MKVLVVGLGYVGLPIALAFAKKYYTIGFDINKEKIRLYKKGIDVTNEAGDLKIKKSKIVFSDDENVIEAADFIIVTVPTPVIQKNIPDLSFLISATKNIAKHLKSGATIVYESTVYPGVTDEICIPILESVSKKILNKDFYVGYSPERINAGDKKHTFERINKIVSGSNKKTSHYIKKIYKKVLKSNIMEVSSIKVAEASKIIENTQRDINIAFMNEISKIFHLMGIDTKEVIEAAKTKWNFLDFNPGLVGGHCISVDPYYLAYKAKQLRYDPTFILSGRYVNDSMGNYVARAIVDSLIKKNIILKKAKVLILGITFKENVNDIRNSKVVDIVNALNLYNCNVYIKDYNVCSKDVYNMYGLKLSNIKEKVDVVVIAVKHDKYKMFTVEELKDMYQNQKRILFDLHGIYDKKLLEKEGFEVWRL